MTRKAVRIALPVALVLVLWIVPPPAGVGTQAWHLLAIFLGTIAGIITAPLPMGAVAIIGIAATTVTGTLGVREALSGFGNPVIWLIVVAFMISRGFLKTGLGRRIAYFFVSRLGRHSLGLAYGFALTDLILAPAIPSNTARGGGILFPVLRSTAAVYDSDPERGTERRLGSFLLFSVFQTLNVTSAMFLTSMAANPLCAELARQSGVELSWPTWALAASVPGLLSLAIVPALVYRLYPPEIRSTPDAARAARRSLEQMGPLRREERWLLFVFVLLLLLWILGRQWGLNATTAALLGLAMLLITGVLSWDDVLSEKGAWNTLVWFAALVMMASYLNELGFIPWLGERVAGSVGGFPWIAGFAMLAVVYFYSHYLFASNTAHVSSMYAPFLAAAIAIGTPAVLAALVLAFFSNLFSCMTHYGTGPAPIYFGAGYVPMGTWWRLGFVLSLVHLAVWFVVGGLWWKTIGLF